METSESIESLNRQLIDLYGIDTITGQAIWRIAWSEDQFEHRRGLYEDYSPGGLYLRTVDEVRWVPKYRQWIKEKYVLERLVIVPEANLRELPATKVSYEPMFPFQNEDGGYLPPRIDATKFVIDNFLMRMGKASSVRYKDPLAGLTTKEQLEMKSKELDILQEELFGNETDTGDALAHGEAIVVPRNYKES